MAGSLVGVGSGFQGPFLITTTATIVKTIAVIVIFINLFIIVMFIGCVGRVYARIVFRMSM